ncbi:MAG: tRNA-binding protein [Dehalococcoidales bacterium]|nr:tRNA-binding protein [Dehalococcoidales bacterium]
MITYDDFLKVDMRLGRVVGVEDFSKARNPSYKFEIDFGPEIGTKRSCAQLTNYSKDELIGRRIVAVVNFPPKNIAGFLSEVLILGVPMEGGVISLLEPRDEAIIGGRVY